MNNYSRYDSTLEARFRLISLRIIAVCALVIFSPKFVIAGDYDALILSHGPVSYWRLGESSGTTAFDLMGSNNGTYQSNYILGQGGAIDGDSNTSASFDGGSNTRVQVNSFDVAGSGLTMAVWFRADSFGDNRFISKANGTSTSDHWWMLGFSSSTQLKCRMKINGTTRELSPTVSTMSTGEWYFVAATYDGTTMRVYLNGSEVGTASYTGSISTSSGINVGIGNQPSSAGDRAFDGRLDEIAIFNYALSASDVSEIYLTALPPPTLYYVRPDGNNSNSGTGPGSSEAWQTVSSAVDKTEINPGDIVYVMSGTYNGIITPGIDGAASLPIQFIADTDGTIFGGAGGEVILDANGSDSVIHAQNDDYIHFDGFTLVDGNDEAAYWEDSLGGKLSHIKIQGSGDRGVRVKGNSDGFQLINSLIQDRSGYSVFVEDGTADIFHCTIVNGGDDGVHTHGGTTTIQNSIMANNTEYGMRDHGGTIIHDYNLVFGNGFGNFSNTSQNTNEITTDPLFAGSGDYHLSAGSPAINAGIFLISEITDDLEGLTRPVGGGWELGCYEFPLIGHWEFTEGSGFDAADSSGNGNDGTLYGGTLWTSWCSGEGAVQFDGVDDQVVSTGFKGVSGSDPRTITAWIKTSTSGTIVSWGDSGDGELWRVEVNDVFSEGRLGALRVTIGTGYTVGSTRLSNDRWHHIAVVLPDDNDDISNVRLFVDGILETISNSQSGTINSGNTEDVILGGDSGNPYLSGTLDDVRIYAKELSAIEIANMYGLVGYWKFDETGLATQAADSSAQSNHANLVGDSAWADGQVDGAISFDGSGDYASTINSFSPPADGSVAFWMKVPGTPAARQRILGVHNDWEIRQESSGILTFDIGGEGTGFFETSTSVDSPDVWYHIAAVFSATNNTCSVYVNGLLDNSGTGTITSQASGTLSFGTRTGSSEYWQGTLDDVLIFERALCDEEITALAAGGQVPGVRILRWEEIK